MQRQQVEQPGGIEEVGGGAQWMNAAVPCVFALTHQDRELAGAGDRRAYFDSAMVLVRHAADPQPLIGEGWWWGEVIAQPRGGTRPVATVAAAPLPAERELAAITCSAAPRAAGLPVRRASPTLRSPCTP